MLKHCTHCSIFNAVMVDAAGVKDDGVAIVPKFTCLPKAELLLLLSVTG